LSRFESRPLAELKKRPSSPSPFSQKGRRGARKLQVQSPSPHLGEGLWVRGMGSARGLVNFAALCSHNYSKKKELASTNQKTEDEWRRFAPPLIFEREGSKQTLLCYRSREFDW